MTRNLKQKTLLISFMAATIGTDARAKSELTKFSGEGTILFGKDTNPFRLNEQFNPATESFLKQDIRLQVQENKKWRIRLDAEKHNYPSDSTANTQTWGVSARYRPDWELWGGDLQFSVAYKDAEKQFVSRNSGQLFTRGGQDASGRYNYNRFVPEIKWSRSLNKHHDIGFKWSYRDQSYEDLTALGLSNLDYTQHALTINWDYDFAKGWQLKSSISAKSRDYEDRRARSMSGQDIAGSNLDHDYVGGKLGLRHKIDKRHRIFASVAIENREDNGGGYYNTLYRTFAFGSRHRFENKLKLSLKASWSQLAYDRDNPGLGSIEEDVETPGTNGWKLEMEAEYPIFTSLDVPVYWITNIKYWDYASELMAYEYDRSSIATGIRVEF